MEFTITSEQISWFLGIILSGWAVLKIVKEMKKPSEDLHQTIDTHTALLGKDKVRLDEVEASNKMILQCLLVIINHNITGNSMDKMKQVRDDLQEYLIER